MSVAENIQEFLLRTSEFAGQVEEADRELWKKGLIDWAIPAMDASELPELRDAQQDAWEKIANQRVSLVLGPPGTGKTFALSWMTLGYWEQRRRQGLPRRMLVTGFTRTAILNLLRAIQKRREELAPVRDTYLPKDPSVTFIGYSPEDEPGCNTISPTDEPAIRKALDAEDGIIGTTVWTLFRMLKDRPGIGPEGPVAPLFDLVCIDEASQMKVGEGLMALAGLAEHGRILVAGDNKQLQPIGELIDPDVDKDRIGGSLYTFLGHHGVQECVFDETFRLSAPLVSFPSKTFYDEQLQPVEQVRTRRLELKDDWADEVGLPWEQMALDPDNPICVLLHDGPPCGTRNDFEARTVARLAKLFAEQLPSGEDDSFPADLWQEKMAVISPHRRQNLFLRKRLERMPFGESPLVDTVDRIQGQERDIILLSYTVSDPEFAQAEAEFLFSPERLNVAITRARTKLVVLVSRRLFDVIPADEEVFQNLQTLRNFVFSTEEVQQTTLPDDEGIVHDVSVRVSRFPDAPELDLEEHEISREKEEPLPDFDDELEQILREIRRLAIQSSYGDWVISYNLSNEFVGLSDEQLFQRVRDLQRLGYVEVNIFDGGAYWNTKPLSGRRPVFACGNYEVVRQRLEQIFCGYRNPRYDTSFRNRFDWLTEDKQDRLRPIVEELEEQGELKLVKRSYSGGDTIREFVEPVDAAYDVELLPPPEEELENEDFELLNRLESIEQKRINFGVFEGWSTIRELANDQGLPVGQVRESVRRLELHGYVMQTDNGRVRSRFAELARELRYVKQRFEMGDADERPFLVRSLKVHIEQRQKPGFTHTSLSNLLEQLKANLSQYAAHITEALDGLQQMLRHRWAGDESDPVTLAGFQARAFESLLSAWTGRSSNTGFVIKADTGSGKTEAAFLPLLTGVLLDRLQDVDGTRVVQVYPRIRLATNQAQRFVGYLAALQRNTDLPTITIGLQTGDVPSDFSGGQNKNWLEGLWERIPHGSGFNFPFFGCPNNACEGQLSLHPDTGHDGCDRLECRTCGWHFDGWVGSKEKLGNHPPNFFLSVTESLHQWQHDTRYGALFGDSDRWAAPKAVLADEIHLYTHIHGVQIGYTLRRLLARAQLNSCFKSEPLAIGMSATLGRAREVWGQLIGRSKIVEMSPTEDEREPNPRGTEYFYFVQPEVESRDKRVAGASTTIQSIMCLAHGMRRRTGKEGGYRGLVFFDSIDKLKRLHSDYSDAERRHLASLRTRQYEDLPGGQPRTECCGEPRACDAFRDGECWFFAANDKRQVKAKGQYEPGESLDVCPFPVFSGSSGKVEKKISESDLVFATSSLEVGFDDPEMMLVYQHYAPMNLASFVQRKGRGGRGADDRPVTGVTLSAYSPRDSYYFRRPTRMLNAENFEVPINPTNYFVRRGQVLATVLDLIGRVSYPSNRPFEGPNLPLRVQREAEQVLPVIFGKDVIEELGYGSLEDLWTAARQAGSSSGSSDGWLSAWREDLSWVPNRLFDTINLPSLSVYFELLEDSSQRSSDNLQWKYDDEDEDIALALAECAPGNVTRRWGRYEGHWILPKPGYQPWFDSNHVKTEAVSVPFATSTAGEELLHKLPAEVCITDDTRLASTILRPTDIRVRPAGYYHYGEWQSLFRYDEDEQEVYRDNSTGATDSVWVAPKSRSYLRGFVFVRTDSSRAAPLSADAFGDVVDRIFDYRGEAGGGAKTGLSAYRVYWAADIDLRLQYGGSRRTDNKQITQFFTDEKREQRQLYGYHLETEGIQFDLDTSAIDTFLENELEFLGEHPSEERWLHGQFLRYLLQRECHIAGLSVYAAQRVAELLVAAAGDESLRKQLRMLLNAWDENTLSSLLHRAYEKRLQQHPLLTANAVDDLVEEVREQEFQQVLKKAIYGVKDDKRFRDYLRSLVVHGVGLRLRDLFVRYGRGDERRVLFHIRLPIQFPGEWEDMITVFENGNHGDGTTRTFTSELPAIDDWDVENLGNCPNAEEDRLIRDMLEKTTRHPEWLDYDPSNTKNMKSLAQELGLSDADESGVMNRVIRILYGVEEVGVEQFRLYDLAREVNEIREREKERMRRSPSGPELVGAVVKKAQTASADASETARLLNAYESIDEGISEESLSAEARLADQVFRLGTKLCVDGCPACLHTDSNLMSLGLTEVTVSRRVLERFGRFVSKA